jgi:hypothetical protein
MSTVCKNLDSFFKKVSPNQYVDQKASCIKIGGKENASSHSNL